MKGTVKKISTEFKHFSIPILVLAILISLLWCRPSLAFAGQEQLQGIRSEPNGTAVKKTDEEYHTPLAGEPFHLEFMGRSIDIPFRDRGNVSSLELGGGCLRPWHCGYDRHPYVCSVHEAHVGKNSPSDRGKWQVEWRMR